MFEWFKKLFKKNKYPNYISLGGTTLYTVGFNTAEEEDLNDNREEVKPIEIIHLLESGCSVSVYQVNKKILQAEKLIATIKKLNQTVPADLYRAYEMLLARKKYPKHFKKFTWKTTTEEKIKELTTKYKLLHRSYGEFIGSTPPQALEEMVAFNKAFKSITESSASFTIIAPPKYFKSRKGDPILLAYSPFGDFYYILCAWDKEVEIVEELLSSQLPLV
jgi:hypothetical protein